MTTTLEDFFSETLPPPDPLRDDLIDMIRQKAASNPRHLQRELGPSEVGHPCARKLALGLMQVPRCNPEWDCLPSAYGVAMHTWLEHAAQMANERLGYERWITERRVEIRSDLWGTCDLYDTQSATVIDWKNLGYTSFDVHVKDPGVTYKHQVQLYGMGFSRLGYEVKQVAIALLPRTGTLTKMHLERMDYDESIGQRVLDRRDAVIEPIDTFDVENNPDRYEWFPKTPDACVFCPWWSPNPKSPIQCDGKAS
jgi:hypothetical protein